MSKASIFVLDHERVQSYSGSLAKIQADTVTSSGSLLHIQATVNDEKINENNFPRHVSVVAEHILFGNMIKVNMIDSGNASGLKIIAGENVSRGHFTGTGSMLNLRSTSAYSPNSMVLFSGTKIQNGSFVKVSGKNVASGSLVSISPTTGGTFSGQMSSSGRCYR